MVRVYVRELDRAEATELPGTDNARGLFFSPDGQWIGYFSPESTGLSKVSTHGGAPLVICRQCAGGGRGAAWGPDNTIVFTAGGGARGLLTVNANGGAPTTLAVPDREKGEFYVAPDILPGGGAIVFTIHKGSADTAEIAVFDRATRATGAARASRGPQLDGRAETARNGATVTKTRFAIEQRNAEDPARR